MNSYTFKKLYLSTKMHDKKGKAKSPPFHKSKFPCFGCRLMKTNLPYNSLIKGYQTWSRYIAGKTNTVHINIIATLAINAFMNLSFLLPSTPFSSIACFLLQVPSAIPQEILSENSRWYSWWICWITQNQQPQSSPIRLQWELLCSTSSISSFEGIQASQPQLLTTTL